MRRKTTPLRGLAPGRHGFTLIEVLVVVAIIALLVAILLPSLSRARAQTRRAVCMTNMHQIYLGLIMYKESNNDSVPDWIALGKYYFRRAPGMTDPSSGSSLQETFGMNALLAGVGPVEKGSMAGTRKKYLSGTSDVWRCPAAPGWMWEQWRNTYSWPKNVIGVGYFTTNNYTKLMNHVKFLAVDPNNPGGKRMLPGRPEKISILQDNYSWKPGNCGWMGSDSWGSNSGYKLTNLSPPHAYGDADRKGAAGSVILWLDGNAGKGGGKRGL